MFVAVLRALDAFAVYHSKNGLRVWQSIMQHGQTPAPKLDARGIPTKECPSCASELFTIQAWFADDYTIGGYLLNAECAMCGTLVTAPTPLDKNV